MNEEEDHLFACPAVYGLDCKCAQLREGMSAEEAYEEAKVASLNWMGYTVIVDGKEVPPEFTRGKIDKQDNGRKGGEEA